MEHVNPQEPYFVVTHSLGGILIREALAKKQIPYPQHCFLLAPPNHGSPIPSFLGKYKTFRKWLGPSFCQLADVDLFPLCNYAATLGNIPAATTTIIGNKNLDFYFAPLFDGQNDGKVSLKSAQGIGEKECITGPWAHMNIMREPLVLEYIHRIIVAEIKSKHDSFGMLKPHFTDST